MKKIAIAATAAFAMLGLAGCESAAETADRNVSRAADNFEVQRRIVAVNGFTDEFLFEIEGRCSWERDGNYFRARCKHGDDDIRRHDLVVGDNTTVVSEQLEGIDASTYRTRIILRPETILPTIEMDLSWDEDE